MQQTTPRQVLLGLQEGQCHAVTDPNSPDKVIAQMMLANGVYYITGPLYSDLFNEPLQKLQQAGSDTKADTGLTFELINELLQERGCPPEATIFACADVEDAQHTLQGLFKAYSLRVVGEAVVSNCGQYRYLLTRTWTPAKPPAVFIMLNPSTADADEDDPTIRRCMGFAKAWGFGGIVVANLYGLRATNPKQLEQSYQASTSPLPLLDIVGPENDIHVVRALQNAGVVVAAWGATRAPLIAKRVHVIQQLVRESGNRLLCLSLTKDGHPGHPLYQPANQPLQTFK